MKLRAIVYYDVARACAMMGFRLECLNSRIVAAIQMNEALACFKAGQQGAKQLGSTQRGAEIDDAYRAMLHTWPTEMHAFKRSEEA